MQAIRSSDRRGIAPIQQLYNPLKLGVMGWVVIWDNPSRSVSMTMLRSCQRLVGVTLGWEPSVDAPPWMAWQLHALWRQRQDSRIQFSQEGA